MPSTGTITVFVIGLMLILAGAWYYFSGQYTANSLPQYAPADTSSSTQRY